MSDLEDKNTIYASCIIFMHIINLLVVCLFLMKWVGWTFWLSANYNNKLFYHHHAFPNFKRLFWPQESILDGWLYNPELMDSFSQIMLLHLYFWWYRWVVKMIFFFNSHLSTWLFLNHAFSIIKCLFNLKDKNIWWLYI